MCDTHRVRHLLTSLIMAVAILLGGVGLDAQTVAASTGFVQPEAATSTPSPWSSGTLAETPQGNPSSISCPVSSFCMAIDAQGNVITYDGKSWSEPSYRADPAAAKSTVTPTISCVSSSFCVVVDGEGNALTYDGTSRSTPDFIDSSGGIDSVSCSSVKFCVAVNVGTSSSSLYDGTKWTGPPHPSARSWVSAQSHASLHNLCVAGSSSNGAFIYSGTSWSATPLNLFGGLSSVSCHSPSFCAAVTNVGSAVIYQPYQMGNTNLH